MEMLVRQKARGTVREENVATMDDEVSEGDEVSWENMVSVVMLPLEMWVMETALKVIAMV